MSNPKFEKTGIHLIEECVELIQIICNAQKVGEV